MRSIIAMNFLPMLILIFLLQKVSQESVITRFADLALEIMILYLKDIINLQNDKPLHFENHKDDLIKLSKKIKNIKKIFFFI